MINHKNTFNSYGVQLGALARARKERRARAWIAFGKLLQDIVIVMVAIYVVLLLVNILN